VYPSRLGSGNPKVNKEIIKTLEGSGSQDENVDTDFFTGLGKDFKHCGAETETNQWGCPRFFNKRDE
jgi:hypothetical protein